MKKKTLKICAALLAFALIAFVLVFASAFMGNPLSKLIVSINSKNYIEKNSFIHMYFHYIAKNDKSL